MIATVERYRDITVDTTSSDNAVTGALVDAQELVEEYLRRPLEEAERTESVRINRNGRVYPKVTPITAVDSDYEIVGHSVKGVSPGAGEVFEPYSEITPPVVELTYTGGWTTETLPKTIEKEIVRTAYALLHPSPGLVRGAKSVSVGDVSISYDKSTVNMDDLDDTSRRRLKRYRYRLQ